MTAKRAKRKSKSEIKRIVADAITQATDWNAVEREEVNRQALNYYWGRMPANKPGRSQVVSLDVADMTEAVLSQMMPAFTTDQLVQFEPLSQDDDSAEDESVAVNHVVMEQNDGYIEFSAAIKNTLLKRNGIIRVEMESREEVESDQYENVTPLQLQQLMQVPPNGNGVSYEQETSDVETDGELTSLTIKRTKTKQKLCVVAVDPTNCGIDPNYEHYDLQRVPYFWERSIYTRSDLVEMGYSKAKVWEAAPLGFEDNWYASAKNPTGEQPTRNTTDPAAESIECYRVFILMDEDGDGITERREIWIAGGRDGIILSDEIVPAVPYALGVAFIMPHTWQGVSLFDKLKQIQDSKTGALRAYMDNNVNALYGRNAVIEGQVNYGDAQNVAPGGIVRVLSRDSIWPLQTIDVGPSAQALLEYQDKMRSERGGASLDLNTTSAQISGETAHGVERQYTSREQLAQMMALNIAETLIKQTYMLVHMTMRTDSRAPITLKSGARWLEANPSDWPERDRLNVIPGASVSKRMARQASLEKLLGFQMSLAQSGGDGVLVDMAGAYKAMVDWGNAAELDNPEVYFVDPDSEEAQQAAQAKQQAAQAQAQQLQQMQALQVEQQNNQQQNQIAAMGDQLKAISDQQSIQQKYFSDWLKAEIEEAKIVGQATLDLEQAERAVALKAVESGPNEQAS